MLTPTWHYVAGDMRLPQVAASPPPRDLPSILWKTSDVRCESQTENKKKATNSWKKRNQTEEEGENSQGAETRGFDTLIQSQRSWANTAVGVVLLSGMLWQRFGFAGQGARAGTQGSHRNPAGPSFPAGWAVRAWCPLLNTPVSLSVQLCFIAAPLISRKFLD